MSLRHKANFNSVVLRYKPLSPSRNGNFRAQPISLTASIGSRLKHSFTNIGTLRSTTETPIQAIDARLIEEEDEDDEDKRKRKRDSATKWGAGVAAGSTMFAALLIGGTFIATKGEFLE